MSRDSVIHLPINHLQTNPFQPRDKIKKEQLNELIESIKVHGILEPLVVAETPAGFQIIAGERRWRAAKEAGLKEVPVYIKKTSRKGMLEMALVENVQRKNLNPIERALAFKQLQINFGLSPGEIARQIGKSAPFVSNSYVLLELPDAIKDGLIGNLITEGHARALCRVKSESLKIAIYKTLLKENGSVRRAEDLARRAALGEKASSVRPKIDEVIKYDDETKKWQEKFAKLFQSKTKLSVTRTIKQTKVVITLQGDVTSTQKDFEKIIKLAEKDS